MKYNHAIAKLDMPVRFRSLPVDDRGYPVPRFVEWIEGKPDFRVVSGEHMRKCLRFRVCWLCGEQLGRHMAFVIGPMCSINRVSSEPPSHLECARFAVKACPFMVNPQRKRNDHDLPDNSRAPPGMIERNPGVMLIWVTQSYRRIQVNDGLLFKIGDPTLCEWYCRGRPATREEILGSIDSGLPQLRKLAELDGIEAVRELEACVKRGLELVV